MREMLRPTSKAEDDAAAEAEEKWRTDIRDLLDETTPGGIGSIAALLSGAKPEASTAPAP
jgi:hypothetical protein